MKHEGDDSHLPPLRVISSNIQASVYNSIRLGLLRLNNPLVYRPPKFRSIKCILTNDKWVCLDEACNSLPIVVWREFHIKNRAIHQDVPCTAYVYHFMAGYILGTVLYDVEEYINKNIQKQRTLEIELCE